MTWKQRIQKWLSYEQLDVKMKEQLQVLAQDEKLAEDAFYQDLVFGTGGMRGEIGPGTNRMNVYTVRKASKGIADYIESFGEDAMARGVAVAFDNRHMSPEFAEETARTFAASGIRAYVYESTRTSPQLSFTVRELNAFMGIVITASHNPAEYNGYKVYGEDGAQLNIEAADRVIEFVSRVEDELTIDNERYDSSLLDILGEDLDRAYIDQVLTVQEASVQPISVVFTPLHGASGATVRRMLDDAGYTGVHYVEEQMAPDGDFPTVESPNPEEPAAFDLARKYGEQHASDILIAIDPDGDRVGVAVWTGTQYELLTGNQTGGILLEYLLSQKKEKGELPENGRIFKTIVTSGFGEAVAKSYGVESEDVLTGFKFIGEKLRENDKQHEFTFLFGYEESYGYLISDFARDKDANQATLLLVEAAAYYKKRGKNLYAVLNELYERHGFYRELLVSVTKKGIEGARDITRLLDGLRDQPPQSIAGIAVEKIEDYESRTRTVVAVGTSEAIVLPRSNVLKYFLQDGSWVCVRPSGTEPKVKYYFGVKANTQQESDEKLELLKEAFLDLVSNR
ncbi:phospho-sugar mutase [Planococcus sp. ISL-109]|uniref:phospho-sugar mutase n=1 Tax=Planococcus sp. ISL-109 TaxID=2819166 RepID=UPI001BE68727|nr:phospho-sugar mutase [Planococcus sp. ISL-109]MBT2584151.1 phospho-sugar mutase [Planococcus sp. ISL-109]